MKRTPLETNDMSEPTFQIQVDQLLADLAHFDRYAWDMALFDEEDYSRLQHAAELCRKLAADLQVLSHLCHHWGRASVQYIADARIEHIEGFDCE